MTVSLSWASPLAVLERDDPPGGYLVLSPEMESPIALTGTAGEIWAVFREPVTVRDAIEHIAAEFELSPADIENDVHAFVNDLTQIGLLITRPLQTQEKTTSPES
jgi:hypothetical protein